jgi:hypothetical protein
MDTENLSLKEEAEEIPSHRNIMVELEQGSVSVSRDGLIFSITGKNVKLQSGWPLNLTFAGGEVQFDDDKITVRADGEAVKLQLD